jgi:hypothetical protein
MARIVAGDGTVTDFPSYIIEEVFEAHCDRHGCVCLIVVLLPDPESQEDDHGEQQQLQPRVEHYRFAD